MSEALGKTIALVLECFSKGLPTPQEGASQVSPAHAEGAYLDLHALLHGLARYGEESDATLRRRLYAVFRAHHVARGGLEEHLSALAGVRVKLSDTQSNTAESEITLDGTRVLDGSWQLGGQLGGNLEPGRYLVIFKERPFVPLELLLYELNRLRPVGTVPRVTTHRSERVAMFYRIRGTKHMTYRRALDVGMFAGYRRLDGSWTLDGSVTLNQTTVVRHLRVRPSSP